MLKLESINMSFLLAKVISWRRDGAKRVETGSAGEYLLPSKELHTFRSRCPLVPWQEAGLGFSLYPWKDGARIKVQGLCMLLFKFLRSFLKGQLFCGLSS